MYCSSSGQLYKALRETIQGAVNSGKYSIEEPASNQVMTIAGSCVNWLGKDH